MISKNTTNNVKAVAITMVMLGHLIGAKRISIPMPYLDIATFGVSLFLFISGYGLVKSYDNAGLNFFFKKRFSAVYIPFVVGTVFVGLIRGFWGDRWFEIVKTILFLNPELPIDGTMWYIYFISIWYISFYITFRVFNHNALRLVVLTFISIAIYNIPINKNSEVLTFLFPFHAFTFVIGVATGMSKDISRRTMFILGLSCLMTFLYLFQFHFGKYNYLNHTMTSMISAPAFILMLAAFDIKSKIMTFISSISYELYLFEGAFRRIIFSDNEITSCIIFFLLTGCVAYSVKVFISSVKGRL